MQFKECVYVKPQSSHSIWMFTFIQMQCCLLYMSHSVVGVHGVLVMVVGLIGPIIVR